MAATRPEGVTGWHTERVAPAPAETGGTRRTTMLLLLAALLPLVLGIDPLFDAPASRQFAWSQAIWSGIAAKSARTVPLGAGPPVPGRLIFVGGSSVTFGIDARALERALAPPPAPRPVLPLGLNAGIGVDVIAAEALRLARPGDTIILMPELAQFERTPGNRALRSDWLRAHPPDASILRDPLAAFPIHEWFAARERARNLRQDLNASLARMVQGWRGRPAPPRDSSPYSPHSIDADGNLTFPRPAPAMKIPPPPDPHAEFDAIASRGIRAINLLQRECPARGLTFLAAPAPRIRTSDESWEQTALRRESAWLALAADHSARILLHAGATIFPPEDGFDTPNHLNHAGSAALAERLARALRRHGPGDPQMPQMGADGKTGRR